MVDFNSFKEIFWYAGSILSISLAIMKIHEYLIKKPKINVEITSSKVEINDDFITNEDGSYTEEYTSYFTFHIKLYNKRKEDGVLKKIILISKTRSKKKIIKDILIWEPSPSDEFINQQTKIIKPFFNKRGYFELGHNPIKLKFIFSNHKRIIKKVYIPQELIRIND